VDADGWTPLHAAVSGANGDVVYCLLQAGADINAVNEDKETPFDLAEEESIRKILLGEGPLLPFQKLLIPSHAFPFFFMT